MKSRQKGKHYYNTVYISISSYFCSRLIKSKHLKAFKRHCHSFFLEIVSSLCFGGESAPEEALIKMLMDVIFTDDATCEITHDPRADTDETPVIRSSLLQLLLEHE
jgi:hypothetical protein